ncbi:hypothetical protein QJS10_CPB12g01551 [Acorus calamus]|uniref:Uncharacterized protein n=1 Tax=Acorus calamus TaxID=4465 RepID=A0AAV9DLX3_ACOCL|nr:hypothetical protein QJS10_CPB12g01551 [Acorus calamus]
MAGIPELALVSGQKIPVVGFGTKTAPLPFDPLVSIFLTQSKLGNNTLTRRWLTRQNNLSAGP